MRTLSAPLIGGMIAEDTSAMLLNLLTAVPIGILVTACVLVIVLACREGNPEC